MLRNLINLRHGIENPDFLAVDSSPVKVAGTVKDFEVDSSDPEDWLYPSQYKVPRATIRSFSPHVLYGVLSSKQFKTQPFPKKKLRILLQGSTLPLEVRCEQSTSTFKKWTIAESWLQSIGNRGLHFWDLDFQPRSCARHPRIFDWLGVCMWIIWPRFGHGTG